MALNGRILKKRKVGKERSKEVCIPLTAVQSHIISSLILTEILCRIQQTKQVMGTGEGEKRILWILHLFSVNIVDSATHRENHYLVDKCLKKRLHFPVDRDLSRMLSYPLFEQPGQSHSTQNIRLWGGRGHSLKATLI